MEQYTTPVFVIGSGRCGTRTIYKMLSGIDHIEIYHEYLCTHIQQVAAMYSMGIIDSEMAKKHISHLHGAAIYYSQAKYWVDCSNKLSWLIEPLLELFPSAKFLWLIRDGRKVVSSFYHKLPDEMYDDESVRIMEQWLQSPTEYPTPPPEKKYWWNIPRPGMPFYQEFKAFNRFQRICYHWAEVNRIIARDFRSLPPGQKLSVRLEDLTSNREVVRNLLAFFDVDYQEHFFEFLQTPRNVIFPMDFKLTKEQGNQFYKIASPMMEHLGYMGKKEYAVKY